MADTNEKLAIIENDIQSLEYDLLKIRREKTTEYKITKHKSANLGNFDEEFEQEELSAAEQIIFDLADFSNQASYDDARFYLEKAREMEMDPVIYRGAYRLFLIGALTKKCHKCWYGIGLCTYHGYGMEADKKAGDQIFEAHVDAIESLAKNGDSEAMIIMYECYEYGYGVFPNKDKAKEWLDKAVNAKNPRALYLCAGVLGEDKSIDMLMSSFNKGFHLSFYALGLAYYHGYYSPKYNGIGTKGQTVDVDYEKAISYNRRGALLGDNRCLRRQIELRELKNGFNILNGVLVEYTGNNQGSVTLPECVKIVEAGSLSRCRVAKEVIFSESITFISPDAFSVSSSKYLPKLTSVNKSYDIKAYRKQIDKHEMHRKRENVKETLFVNNPHKTFTISWLVLLLAFLVTNLFVPLVPLIRTSGIMYSVIFGGCGIAVFVGYILAMAKDRSGWQVIVGSAFVSVLLFLAAGNNLIPDRFRMLAVIGTAILTFCGIVITYFRYPGEVFGNTITFAIIVAVIAAPFVAFEIIFPHISTADTLVKASCLIAAVTMAIGALYYKHWRKNWDLHRILFLVFYAILMVCAYLIGGKYELISAVVILASVAATVYAYIIFNDYRDKPMRHGLFKLITTFVVVTFFAVFDGVSFPNVFSLIVFLACAIAMVVDTVVVSKQFASEFAEIICVPFFGIFVSLALFGGAMSYQFIFIATVAAIIATVISIMLSAERDWNSTALRVVVIVCAVLLVVAVILSGVDFSSWGDQPITDSTNTDYTEPDYNEPDYNEPDYSFPDTEKNFLSYIGFNPIMLIFGLICLFSGIRAKKEWMDRWQIGLCFIFTALFGFLTVFGNGIFADASSKTEIIIFIGSIAVSAFAIALSRVDDWSGLTDWFDDNPKGFYIGIPIVTAIVTTIGLSTDIFYLCVPNVLMVIVYAGLAFLTFCVLFSEADMGKGVSSIICSVAMTVYALSALFGGMYPIWLHIAIVISFIFVCAYAAD